MQNFELKPHQEQAIEFLLKTPKAALFMATGTGKTLVSLMYLKILNERALIIVEASKKHIWIDENAKFSIGLEITTDWRCPRQITLVSYDWVKNNTEIFDEFDVIIFDESHCISDPETIRYKKIAPIVKTKSRVILLSGYPVENHLQEIFVVSLISEVLGKNYHHFLHKFFHVIREPRFNRIVKVLPQKGALERIIHLIEPIAFVVDKKDVMPENIKKESVIVRYSLSEEQIKLITELREGGCCSIDSKVIMCANALVVFQKAMQLISGFVYLTNDESELYPIPLRSNPKLKLLDELVKERSDFLLWYLYDYEYEILKKYKNVCRLSKLQTDSRGLNLQDYKFAVYFTLPLSGGQYLQSQDRLYRIGRTTDVLSVTLLPEGEFGDKLSMMMNRKQKLTDKFIMSLLESKL